jgi:hypothetical protein
MKKYYSKIFIAIAVLLSGTAILLPQSAHAIDLFDVFPGPESMINSFLSFISYKILEVVSTFVTAGGLFLSISINLTTHIKDIYETISGIKSVWVVVRDLSSMFIIFILLYASIMTIIGREDESGFGSVGKLIVKIFLAGIFINFSLFFVRVAVDASNLVSLQFYRAIAPQTENNWTVNSAYYDGGLSNILLQSMKVQKVYAAATAGKGLDIATGIFFATIGGIIIMVTAGLSLFAAAIAFTARTAILLFVMAVSPLFFAGMIFPKIKQKVSDPLFNLLKGQLIFMPVYLFLLYVALKVISDDKFNAIFTQQATGAAATAQYAYVWSGIIIQYTIAILFINAPLVAAIALGGKGMKWTPDAKAISKRFGGFFGRNTFGRAGKYVGESFDNMAAQGTFLGSKTLAKYGAPLTRFTKISQASRHVLSSAEKARYGSPQNLAEMKKEDKERAKTVAAVGRANQREEKIGRVLPPTGLLARFKNVPNPTEEDKKEFRKAVGGMDVKEMQDMDMEELTNPTLITAVPAGKFESLLKEMSPSQQQQLKDAREKAFKELVDPQRQGGPDVNFLLKTLLKGKPGEIAKLPGDVLKHPDVATQLDAATLRKIVEEGVGSEVRDEIRDIIEGYSRSFPNITAAPRNIQGAIKYFDSQAGVAF